MSRFMKADHSPVTRLYICTRCQQSMAVGEGNEAPVLACCKEDEHPPTLALFIFAGEVQQDATKWQELISKQDQH